MPYGIVKEVHKHSAVVIMERQDMCGDCHACEMMSGKKTCTLTCRSLISCKVGDRVEVTLTNKDFLKATYIVYGIPLVGFLIGMAIGYGLSHIIAIGGEDIWAGIGATLGTFLGVVYIKWKDGQEKYDQYLPYIVKREI